MHILYLHLASSCTLYLSAISYTLYGTHTFIHWVCIIYSYICIILYVIIYLTLIIPEHYTAPWYYYIIYYLISVTLDPAYIYYSHTLRLRLVCIAIHCSVQYRYRLVLQIIKYWYHCRLRPDHSWSTRTITCIYPMIEFTLTLPPFPEGKEIESRLTTLFTYVILTNTLVL